LGLCEKGVDKKIARHVKSIKGMEIVPHVKGVSPS